MSAILCQQCPRKCVIEPGKTGICSVRGNQQGALVLAVYGQNTGLRVDPIEKKPLYHFLPGSNTLSFGTIGCNLKCPFCQNWTTSQSRDFSLLTQSSSPESIAELAKTHDCQSVAFTYNEPIVWAEYAVDTAIECHKKNVKTVAVSAGYISSEKRQGFFGQMDAVNIDLKSFSEDFYRDLCGISLEPVKETLQFIAKETGIWLEITNLLIPGKNDSDEEITAMCNWIRRELGAERPLHFSAFRPTYKMTDVEPTPSITLFRARDIAKKAGLCHVYIGNLSDPLGQSTYCPQCQQEVLARTGFEIGVPQIDEEGCCRFCGQSLAGFWKT
ncbi:MAG: AmmeMemoRadiSam system radical SAM enzyme [Thermoguttaceae bacterium]